MSHNQSQPQQQAFEQVASDKSIEFRWRELRATASRAERFETTFEGDRRLVWHCWGAGPDLLLLHGGGGSWTHWYSSIVSLESRHRIWVPDLPGYGDSDMPSTLPLSFDALAGFVTEGFRQLAPRAARLDVAGFSFGTQVMMPLLRQLDSVVLRAVIVGMNFVEAPNPKLNFVNWKKAKTEAERDAAIRANLRAIMIAHEQNLDEFAMRMQRENLARQRLSPITIEGKISMLDLVPRVPAHIRVSAISGRQDFIAIDVMDRQAAALAALRPGSDFHVIDSSGHWVMHENPAEFNRVLAAVFAR